MRHSEMIVRSKSLAHEAELLSLQEASLKLHHVSLEQGQSVLSTVSATRSQLEELTVVALQRVHRRRTSRAPSARCATRRNTPSRSCTRS